MHTSSIVSPSPNAVFRLGAISFGAGFMACGKRTYESIKSSFSGDLVVSALEVHMLLVVVLALGVTTPSSNTIYWLSALRGRARIVTISKWAIVAVV